MTIDVVREHGITEGAEAWPIFRDSEQSFPGRDLSVLTIQVRRTESYNLDDAARSAVAELQRIIDAFAHERALEAMLFVAHGTKQPNSPLVLRKSLWDSLRTQYGLPEFSRTYEHLAYRSDSGHRKAGLAVLCRAELDAAAPGLRRIRSAALLLADRGGKPDSVPLDRLFELAFGTEEPAGQIEWGKFVPGCLELGFLPVRIVGEFDDRDLAVDVFANRGLVDALA